MYRCTRSELWQLPLGPKPDVKACRTVFATAEPANRQQDVDDTSPSTCHWIGLGVPVRKHQQPALILCAITEKRDREMLDKGSGIVYLAKERWAAGAGKQILRPFCRGARDRTIASGSALALTKSRLDPARKSRPGISKSYAIECRKLFIPAGS